MENKKIMFLIMLIIIIVLAVSASTYAFLQPGWRRFNEVGFGTATGGTATFTAYSDKDISINIVTKEMGKNFISDEAIATANSNISIQIEGGTNDSFYTCDYDLVWVWDSEDQYKVADTNLPYTHEDGTVYPYEFSVKVDNELEVDLSSLSWDVNKAIITTKSISVSKGEIKKQTIPIDIKIYNIPIIQNTLSGKIYRGHIEVSAARCKIEPKLLAITEAGDTLADAIKRLYVGDGSNDLYLHDKKNSHFYPDLEAGDNSYRFAGIDPKNYICFGSEAQICSEDNLYRIIGVFGDNVKLYKYKSIGNMAWDTSRSNTWENSSLEKYLNSTFLNSLGNYSKYIIDTTWSVGGIADTDYPSHTIYEEEMNNSTTINRKIGLMYAQEYGFSSSQNYWYVKLFNFYSVENWMYSSDTPWTISKWKGNDTSVNFITRSRIVNSNDGNYEASYARAVYPTFSLKSNVFYAGGNGTKDDPIRIDDKSISGHIIAQYTADGTNALYYHDGSGSYTNANLEAGDYSYRYSGTNPNNYVCFDGTNCENTDNLYRIIGVFDGQTKLMKLTLADYKTWNVASNNTYENSIIDKYLNEDWILNMGYRADLIADAQWHVGGVSQDNTRAAKGFFDLEQADTTIVTRKIGLMYPSEYGYASIPTYWSREIYNYEPTKGYDWMKSSTGGGQWTISRNNGSNSVFYVTSNVWLSSSGGITNAYEIQPTFYLKPNVRYISGTGTYADPYIIG